MSQIVRYTLLLVTVSLTLAATANKASAISWDELWRRAKQIKKASDAGELTPQQERDLINDAWKEYQDEQAKKGTPIVGQAAFSGTYPSNFLPPGSPGQLQFLFIDTDTGLVTQGPEVGFVVYQVSLDPNLPDNLQWVGVSADPQTHFAFPVNVNGFEPSYIATPFDRAGNPIVIPGVDGDNVAVGFTTVLFPPSHHR
jgi:hypothetical protein